MNSSELIGKVAADYLRSQIADNGDGTARFIIDCLTAEQTAAIALSILASPDLANLFDIKMPASFVASNNLPSSALTHERATYFRNAACTKPALLVANTGDDEEQSLKELVPVGALQLLGQPDIWVRIVSTTLPLIDDHKKWWEKALAGLNELHFVSLERFANYVLRTRTEIEENGKPILMALGASLPELHLPKDSCLFEALNERVRTHTSRWKNLYSNCIKKRACFLNKQTPIGLLLSESNLLSSWNNVSDSIPEANHEAVLAFIKASSGWNVSAANLAEIEWENIKPLFDGLRREKFNLGQETISFYADRESELLNDAEADYLNRLIARKTTEAEEEDELFYGSHRNELREDRKLKSAWDRFIFGTPRETNDFLAGIAIGLEALFNQESPAARRKLKIRCDSRAKKDFKDLNVDAGLYFAHRYTGLKVLFGNRVTWDVGELFSFPKLVAEWKQAKKAPNRSEARQALQLKFTLELEVELLTGGIETYGAQIFWKYDPKQVASELPGDWKRLEQNPLVYCRANRESISGKGQYQTVDLANVKTFMPVYDKDRGSFISVYKKSNDIEIKWRENLVLSKSRHQISDETASSANELFDAFLTTYKSAISGFSTEGLACFDLVPQVKAYAKLLDFVCNCIKGDRNREQLLRPLLQIGTVEIEGGRLAAVVAPWHPFRLAAIAQKAQMLASLLRHLLTVEQVHFGDTRLFFKDFREKLDHAFYPELVLGWTENKPELLSLSDAQSDYSLHEPPLANNDGSDNTNENPSGGATQVLELVKRYLALYPHEQANLSVVLYNCDSARLPQAVVEKISTMYDDDEDVYCQVVLRHRDSKRLRHLYERIVEAADIDTDSFNPSEATQDFMARLRIAIMADQAPVPDPKDGCPTDIAFSQDVISRHARVEWYLTDARPTNFETLVPPRWSRRRPAATDDMKSVVYLCCPVQSAEGWAFLTAITTFLKGDWDGNTSRRLLPARQLDFQDPAMARIFEETHNLANWVVNYDELLDRRQLLNQDVRVIRYKQSTNQGRNIVISSKAPLGLLKSMIVTRLKSLNLDLTDMDFQNLATKFVEDANDISGDIILRAAKRGRNASELMGIALSRFLIRHEVGIDRYYGWYFLDDYADWLGQREEQIADILALSPEMVNGHLRLTIVVAESKYIDIASLAVKRKESQKQLRDTVKRISDALFGNPKRLDRSLWLDRISDLILDGVHFPASADLDLAEWRRAIREGNCDISLRGYSYIFISGPGDANECSDRVKVAGLDDSYQEIYSRAQVRRLISRYSLDEDPMQIRSEAAAIPGWNSVEYRQSTEIYRDTATENSHLITAVISNETHEGDMLNTSRDQADGVVNLISTTSLAAIADIDKNTIKPTESIINSWAYPTIPILLSSFSQTSSNNEKDNEWLSQIGERTRGALQQFQLQSKLISSVLTPNAALLKFAGSANLTVDQITKRRSEFLTTFGLNIVSIQPESGAIALAIERPERQVVRIEELWARWTPSASDGNQELLIAVREDNGELLCISPGQRHAPHTLIAGSTGSGKSVLMQNILLSIAATNTPKEARIILIDPKQGVDYFAFEGLPHLAGGIIDNQEQALSKLEWLVEEMDNRYRRFRDTKSSSLAIFNQKVTDTERLPTLWLVHDEFAEWMMVENYKQHVAAAVGRLGVKARAAGIHLVFAAQRPDANVMPMQLRANLGNRLILRVDSEGTSEIALGEKGAERLLGRGHLLAKMEGESRMYYAQVPLIDTSFIDGIIAAIG